MPETLQDEGAFLSGQGAPLSTLLQGTQCPAPTAGATSSAPGLIACVVSAAPRILWCTEATTFPVVSHLLPHGPHFQLCCWCSTCGLPAIHEPCYLLSSEVFISALQQGLFLLSAIPPFLRVPFACYCQSLITPAPCYN